MISKETKEKISKIKELQSKNHIKNDIIYNTFHNVYKKQPRPYSTSTGKEWKINDQIFYSRLRNKNAQIYKNNDKNSERILSLYSDYRFYNPYVTMMMTRGANVTEYNHKKYIQTESSIPKIDIANKMPKIKKGKKVKKYFGIDGDTPLYDTDRTTQRIGRTTLTDLYSTTSLGMKTITNFPSKYTQNNFFNKNINNIDNLNINNISESDRKTAGDLFLDSFRTKNQRFFSKENRRNFYEDYNIIRKLTVDEESKIDKIINQNQKNNTNFHPIFRDINSVDKTGINTHVVDREFKDPYNSFKKLKINSQMINVIEKINLNFQFQKFQKEYDNICELNMQKNRMPNIRIIAKKKLKTFQDFKAQKYLKIFETSEQQQEQKSKKKKTKNKKENDKINALFEKPQNRFTRSDTLNDLKIKIDYACFIFHPELRTMHSVCFNDEKGIIYIHGGLGGKKLADLWVFLLIPGKIGWHKVYEPNPSSDFDNEPCPRFGHTMHFYNDKLYLIGGEFKDWIDNKVNEGIMCVYDTIKNNWDMMKDKYDFKSFQRKKAEKEAINKEILSYQDITNAMMKYNDNKNEINNNDNKYTIHKIDNNDEQCNKDINQKEEIKNTKITKIIIDNKNKNFKGLHKNLRKNSKLLLNKKINIIKNNNKLSSKNSNSKFNIKKETEKLNNNNENEKQEKEIQEENIIQFPCLRRNHISLLIGTNIFIYGGISQSKKALNDCWIYDLIKNKWSILEFTGRYPPPLFGHCACLALESSQLFGESLSVYHKPISSRKTLPLLKSDGVFFFGGYNDAKVPTNLFFRMVIGIKPVIFEIPEISGKPPSPRIEATMNFYSGNNMIIIHGGRNDMKNELYNDIILLDMESMNWIHPQFLNEPPLERSEHKSIIISSKLFIFGGTNGENMINFDFTIFNIDFFNQNNESNM